MLRSRYLKFMKHFSTNTLETVSLHIKIKCDYFCFITIYCSMCKYFLNQLEFLNQVHSNNIHFSYTFFKHFHQCCWSPYTIVYSHLLIYSSFTYKKEDLTAFPFKTCILQLWLYILIYKYWLTTKQIIRHLNIYVWQYKNVIHKIYILQQ